MGLISEDSIIEIIINIFKNLNNLFYTEHDKDLVNIDEHKSSKYNYYIYYIGFILFVSTICLFVSLYDYMVIIKKPGIHQNINVIDKSKLEPITFNNIKAVHVIQIIDTDEYKQLIMFQFKTKVSIKVCEKVDIISGHKELILYTNDRYP